MADKKKKELTPGVDEITPESFNKDSVDTVNMPGVTPITPESFKGAAPSGEQLQGPVPNAQGQIPGVNPITPGQNTSSEQNAPQQGYVQPAPKSLQVAQNPNLTGSGEQGLAQQTPQATQIPQQSLDFNKKPLDPYQQLDQSSKIWGDRANVLRASADAQSQGKLEEAQTYKAQADQITANSNEGLIDIKKINEEKDRRLKAMDDRIAKGMEMSLDPGRFWHKIGTAGSILAAISIGLGTFGNAMTGGKGGNPALQLITGAIDRDIDAQKSSIENYWKGVKEQGNLDDTAFNRDLVMANAKTSLKIAGLKTYDAQLQSIAAKTQSPIVKAQAENMIADGKMAQVQEGGVLHAQMVALALAQQKARMAGLAAQSARLDKQATERNNFVKEVTLKQIEKGEDPATAALNANKMADTQFPEMALHPQYASPGQKYSVATSQFENFKRMPDKQVVAYMKQNFPQLKGTPDAIILDKANQLKQMSAEDWAASQGIKDPYASTADTQTAANKPILSSLPPNVRDRASVDSIDKKVYVFPNKEMADKYRTESASSNTIINLIGELKSISDKVGPNGFSSTLNKVDYDAAMRLRNQIAILMQGDESSKRYVPQEFKDLFLSQVPDISAWRGLLSTHGEQLNRLLQTYQTINNVKRDSLGGEFYSYGITPATVQPALDVAARNAPRQIAGQEPGSVDPNGFVLEKPAASATPAPAPVKKASYSGGQGGSSSKGQGGAGGAPAYNPYKVSASYTDEEPPNKSQ